MKRQWSDTDPLFQIEISIKIAKFKV
jgi:hypothetical protein